MIKKNKKNPKINISGRLIGKDYLPLVIAEIGINHKGNIKTALKIANSAISAGAEVIKHQTHIVDDEMSNEAKKVIPSHTKDSIYDIMKKCALNEEQEMKLKRYIESKGRIFLSTPFSRAAADRLNKMSVKAFKIGSGECNNYPLIDYICKFKKPMIISTGMNDIKSIKTTVEIVRKNKIPFALLHCTNIYPTPANLVRLGAMIELEEEFRDAIIGLSDHTISNLACLAATALGASILERHFTDTMNRSGPDIINSMNPAQLRELIQKTRNISTMIGGKKIPVKEEKGTSKFAFATVVTICKIKKDETFSSKNIWVKRPGTGKIHAKFYEHIIGKKATHDINNDKHLSPKDIKNFKI